MQYLFIICHDDTFAPTEALVAEIVAWDREMQGRGVRLTGNPLRPPADAMTVRVRDGAVVIIEGPFADTGEKMAAYELVECASLEEAVDVAARHPMARVATIEVRPIWAELAAPTQDRPPSTGA